MKHFKTQRLKSMYKPFGNNGFTILELLISTAVFSVVLLLCATAVVQVGQLFYKGVLTNRVQDTTRKVANDIISTIQAGKSGTLRKYVATNNQLAAVCIGNIRYSFILQTKSLGATSTTQSPNILWKDRIASGAQCNTIDLSNVGSSTGQELLGPNMRLSAFNVTQLTDSSGKNTNSYKIDVAVAYGPTDDVFAVVSGKPDYLHCKARNLGGRFCAVSKITTYATERL